MKKLKKLRLPLEIIVIVLVCIIGFKFYEKVTEIEDKLSDIASQTNTTAKTVDDLNEDFVKYQNNQKKELKKQKTKLNNAIDDIQTQIDDTNVEIESVKNIRVKAAEEQAKKQPVVKSTETTTAAPADNGTGKLTKRGGVYWFGNQKETYYNLDMSGIVRRAKNDGIEGDYWVRSDGAKMYGDYIMIAANWSVHPYGSIVQTSLGAGIVLDTGGFAANNPNQVDIATSW